MPDLEERFPYIWEKPGEENDSYWIFLIDGIHVPLDRELICEALIWKYLNPTAEVVFYQGHEDTFGELVYLFEVDEWPCIIVSDNHSDMPNHYIKFESDLVREIESVDNGITRLLNKLHTDFKNKRTLSEVKRKISTRRFWKWVTTVYQEFKEWKDLITAIFG